MTTDKQFDKLNRLPEIQSDTGFQPVGFHYQYTTGNQHSRAELTDGSLVPGQQFEYQFDDIGNRRETKEGGAAFQAASYTVNSLNQYDGRTVPGAVDIIGLADPATTVQVNEQSTYRRGEYFQKAVTVANNDNPVYQAVNATAGTASSSGQIFVPKMPEGFSYDADELRHRIGAWLVDKDFYAAVRTGLPPKFQFQHFPAFSTEAAISYLKSLTGFVREKAFNYIATAPPTIRTPVREAAMMLMQPQQADE